MEGLRKRYAPPTSMPTLTVLHMTCCRWGESTIFVFDTNVLCLLFTIAAPSRQSATKNSIEHSKVDFNFSANLEAAAMDQDRAEALSDVFF